MQLLPHKVKRAVKDAVICTLGMTVIAIPVAGVSATDQAVVSATVTMENISVTVSDGSIVYGTLSTNTTTDTTSGNLNDSQTASNSGNVIVDLNIRGQNSTDWNLAGAAGSDEYRQRFCTTDCDSSPTWTNLTTNATTLVSDLAAAGTQLFDLEITTPTSSSSFDQQNVDVAVIAVLPE